MPMCAHNDSTPRRPRRRYLRVEAAHHMPLVRHPEMILSGTVRVLTTRFLSHASARRDDFREHDLVFNAHCVDHFHGERS